MPDIESLKTHMQRLAAITAVLSIEYGESEFGYDPNWRKKQQMAVYDNGCGDVVFMHFTTRGCFIKGFAHESSMSPYARADRQVYPGVLDSVPKEFNSSLKEPAFETEATTFALWRLVTDKAWSRGVYELPENDYGDGSQDLLEPITYSAKQFSDWLADNYETEIAVEVVESVFDGEPLTKKAMSKLNPTSPINEIVKAVGETGYPIVLPV